MGELLNNISKVEFEGETVNLVSDLSLSDCLVDWKKVTDFKHIQAYTSIDPALLNPMMGFAILKPISVFTDGKLSIKENGEIKLMGSPHYMGWFGVPKFGEVGAKLYMQTIMSAADLRELVSKLGLRNISLNCVGSSLHKHGG